MNDHDPQLLHVRAPLLHLTMQPESVGVLPEPTGPLLAVRGPLMHLTAMPMTELTATQQPLVRAKATFEMVEPIPPGASITELTPARGPLVRAKATFEMVVEVRPVFLTFTIRPGVTIETAFQKIVPIFGMIQLLKYTWAQESAANGRLVFRLTPPAGTTAAEVERFADILRPLAQVIQDVQEVAIQPTIAA
ncbi:MAG: hypothetical protein ACRCZF_01580 [Gemmataceae bacterium]